ncbi:peroxiredoxin [Prochlorococcus marinus]|uniref:peroxiredoxin n=1 Tax=Prochlorococcus TaxID=1218 RepID=UPI0007B39EC9|nr:peroxiredoxin [Prochlorococcus marinus]
MKRSELLRVITGAAVLSISQCLGRPSQALAMEGKLPALDAQAPDFELEAAAQEGALAEKLQRDAFLGSWLVLYFYPRDFTSGCTLEARGFQRDLSDFKAVGAAVVGVSADGTEEHVSFCSSEGLGYTLLSDPGGVVSERYGSWSSPFSQRHTFLIDPDGILRARWEDVSPSRHSQDVLRTLKELQQS